MSLLEVAGLTAGYGRTTVLRGIDLAVDEGETLFIAGPNGAGKSTLLKTIAGVVRPTAGAIRLAGREIAALAPEVIARLGFSLVPEGRDCFAGLTVEENLKLAGGLRPSASDAAAELTVVYELFPVLRERRSVPAGLLSGGQQQMLVIGRALMTGSRLVAIDEPSLGLAPNIVDQVYESLAVLREKEGLSLLIVEQSTVRASMMGGRLVLLRNGEIALSGDAVALSQGTALRDAYFGYEGAA